MLKQCGVNFSLPKRSPSRHKDSLLFQEAWAEASTRLDDMQLNQLCREQELRTQVAEFAEHHPVNENGTEKTEEL